MAKTNSSIVPPALKQGDKVAIVATARYVDSAVLEFAEKVFKSWGLNPTRGENLLQKERKELIPLTRNKSMFQLN